LHADSFHANTKQSYKTNGGRKVFGGGGIMPDIFVADFIELGELRIVLVE
jgi:hypothetical protein